MGGNVEYEHVDIQSLLAIENRLQSNYHIMFVPLIFQEVVEARVNTLHMV